MQPNAQELLNKLDAAVKRQRALESFFVQSLNLPAGPYSLFHHQGHLIERLEDVVLIVERIGYARARVTQLHQLEAKAKSRRRYRWGVPLPKVVRNAGIEVGQLTRTMRFDSESLYIFANMALDQWAYAIAYSLGLASPEKFTYAHLVNQMQSQSAPQVLRALIEKNLKDAIWLYYHLRFYRNNFIEHVRRPWQRGSTMSVYGGDFNFFIPSPPGWISDEVEKDLVDSIRDLAPSWLMSMPDDYWQKARSGALLEATFKEIDNIPKQFDRDRLWKVWSELGGSVASYDVMGQRLAFFMIESANVVLAQVKNDPSTIDPGSSPHTTS